MRDVQIRAEGMHCEKCPERIRCQLSTLPGVESCEADVDRGFVSVVFDPALVCESEIRDRIRTAGFAASIVTVGGSSRRSAAS